MSGHYVASKRKSKLTVIADRDLMRRDRGEGCRQATRETVSRRVRQGSHHVDLTNRGDIVLDPFLGSRSILIAADKTGRACRGVELDPLYFDVVVL